jgi:hypothetical protein
VPRTLDAALGFMARSLEPLAAELGTTDERLLAHVADLGWLLPEVPPSLRGFQAATDALATSVGQFDGAQRTAVSSDRPGWLDEASGKLGLDALLFVDELRNLSTSLADELPPDFVAATGIAREFHRRLLEDHILRRLEVEHTTAFLALRAAGMVQTTRESVDPARFQPAFTWRRVRWDRMLGLVRHPTEHWRDVLGWGTPNLDIEAVSASLRDLSFAMLRPGRYAFAPRVLQSHVAATAPTDAGSPGFAIPLWRQSPAQLELGVFAAPKDDASEPQGILLTLLATGLATGVVEFGPHWKATAELGFDVSSGLGLVIRPNQPPELVAGLREGVANAVEQGRGRIMVERKQQASRSLVDAGFGSLRAAGFEAIAGIEVRGDVLDAYVEVGFQAASVHVAPESQDGLLARLSAGRALEAELDAAVGWSLRRGLYVRGGAGLEGTIPVHRRLGPISVDAIHLRARATEEKLNLEATLSLTATLGPLRVAADRVGVVAELDVHGDSLGGAGVDVRIQPPQGYGLALDVGPARAAGFLSVNGAQGRYRGAMTASAFGIDLSAVGLLDTSVPGIGYSLLAVLGVSAGSVPLGLGFELERVGGVIGIERDADVDALRAAMRTTGYGGVLFPEDPLASAASLTQQLGALFPPAPGRFLFGPTARVSWGPSGLVRASAALLVSVPDPVTITLLASVDASFPSADAALIDLHVDVLGRLDPGRKRLSLDGSLRNSRVVSFSIEGDMALRVGWGDDATFAFSIGGFHPSFRAPAEFPSLRRVLVPIGLDDDPRVTLQGYLAVTSNTFQIGAEADVYASAGWFNIVGSVDFHALFQFSPFAFLADFSGRVTLRKGETELAGVSLDASISGPAPWRATGKACLILRWLPDPCVGFDASFGQERRETTPQLDPWPVLRSTLEDPRNYRSIMDVSGAMVRVASREALLEPSHGVEVRQTHVPLGRAMTRFGGGAPAGGAARFDMEDVTVDGRTAPWRAVKDLFARSQFEAMTDDEKLESSDFEPMQAGFAAATDALAVGEGRTRQLEYHTEIVDGTFQGGGAARYVPALDAVMAAVANGSGARATRHRTALTASGPSGRDAGIGEERYVVVAARDLAIRHDIAAPTTRSAASAALEQHVSAHPLDRGALLVVAVAEAPGAAHV